MVVRVLPTRLIDLPGMGEYKNLGGPFNGVLLNDRLTWRMRVLVIRGRKTQVDYFLRPCFIPPVRVVEGERWS